MICDEVGAERQKRLREAYDAAMKRLLTDKYILAHLLIACTEEFSGCALLDVVNGSFDGDPVYGEIGLDEDTTNPCLAAQSLGQEHTTSTEGRIAYDTRFLVRVPKSDAPIELIVNVEGQRDSSLPYPICRRGWFYCARMISAQKGSVFVHSEYEKIKKVYSIWICIDPPKYARGTIQKYSIHKEDYVGCLGVEKSAYDVASVVVINVGESCNANYNGILKMLSLIFRTEVQIKESHEILVNEFGFPKRHFNQEGAMKSWAMDLEIAAEKKGFEQGIEKGIEQGIEKGIEQGIEKGLLDMTGRVMHGNGITLERAMVILGLTEEEKKFVRLHLDHPVESF